MKTEIITITPEKAKELLSNNNHNRIIKPLWVNALSEMMLKGQFRTNGDSIKLDNDGNLLDGQHRLLAIIQSKVSVESLIIYDLPKEVHTTLDTGKLRSAGDVFYFENIKSSTNIAAIIKAYLSIKNNKISNIRHSTGCMTDGYNYSHQNLLKEYQNNEEFWKEVNSFSRSCYVANPQINPSVLGGFYAYISKTNKKQAKNFFSRFANLDYQGEWCPIRLLAILFTRNERSEKKYTSRTKLALLIKSWNAFLLNKEIKKLYFNNNEEFPKILIS